jgi:cytochrome P450
MNHTPDVSSVPLDQITPLDTAVLQCPHEFNARMRAEAPVYRCPHTGIVFVFDHATVVRVAADPETFSNRFGAAMRGPGEVDPRLLEEQQKGYPPVDTMLTQDPPVHRRYRSLVNQAFTVRRVNQLEPYVEALANQLIDGFIDAGRCELVRAFCEPLPLTIIADQLGVPRADLELFRSWSDAFVAQLSRKASPDEELEAVKLIVQFQHYFAAKLEERRAAPRDDILSDIVNARLEGERPLDTAEALSILQQLLVAGNETTTSAIAEGMLLLMRNPAQAARLRAEPELIPNLVEEVLRLSTPTANMWRICTRDTELNGMPIAAGTLLQLRYASADRDAALFENPDAFDPARTNARQNVAFGHGVHMCIGASLARKEMNVAFRVLLQRLKNFELACDERDLEYPPNVLLRGLKQLPIRFTSA